MQSASFPAPETCPIDADSAREPIHIPGSIQPHGILIAVDLVRDGALAAISANASRLAGAAAEPAQPTLAGLLGMKFAQAL